VCSGGSVNELPRDPYTICQLAHASFEYVTHTQLTADMLHVDGSALVGESRIPRDDEKPSDTREAGNDVVDHAIAEIFLLWVAAHVLKRQHGDGWFVGERQSSRLRWPRAVDPGSDPIDPYRPGNVLQLPIAKIIERRVDLVPHLAVCIFGNADAARFGDSFKTSCC
jgi:hypothetical protein